ncbi:autotransporter domain-containing protein [Prosthecomicrobium pneumaticum]|uniref:Autotransporter domain-containing protein n=1 Tax=Prosthecomicrobium pneumaticum TaxID=81895 RepID=A0A7W9FLI1_9HYPH|nr:autotransporter domain-containing protein [Prosthecomicrobium pneumaticum]MBB5752865.1 hypothetical protein [Prosthecomicrobium pneumaticum]
MASTNGSGARRSAGRIGGAALAVLLATSILTPASSAELATNPLSGFSLDSDQSQLLFYISALFRPSVLARDGSVALVWTGPEEARTFGLWDGGEPRPITVSDYPFYGIGLSDDGSRYFGTVNDAAAFDSAVFFDGTSFVPLGRLTSPSTKSGDEPWALSGDGSVIVGGAYSASVGDGVTSVPVYWEADGTIHQLYTTSGAGVAWRVSYDGTYAFGSSDDGIYRWDIPGGTWDIYGDADYQSDTSTLGTSLAVAAIDHDGAHMTGYALLESAAKPFVWSLSDGFEQIALPDGFEAGMGMLMSRDGDVVGGIMSGTAGNDITSLVEPHAYRWTEAGGVVDISVDRAERTGTYSDVVTGMSDDGSVIVGITSTGTSLTNVESISDWAAFRWSVAEGWQTVADYFTGKGIDITGMSFLAIGSPVLLTNAISADGTVMVGMGTIAEGSDPPVAMTWLSRCGGGYECGVTTVDGVYRSVESVGASGETANLHVDDLFDTVSHALAGPVGKNGSAYAYGSFDTDPMAGGGVGFDVRLSDTVTAGFLVDQSVLDTDLAYDGWSSFDATSVVAKIAGRPAAGFVWEAGLAAAWLDGDVKRGYLNGVDPVTSRGDTSGYTLGASATLGWRFALPAPATSLTPYATYTVMQSDFDGWTETNGPFPAVISGFTTTTQLIRAGLELEHRFAAGPTARLGLAGVHRETDGDTIAFDLPGLFGGTVEGDVGAANWLETSLAFDVPFGASVSGLAKVTGRLPDEGDASVAGHIGLKIAY